MTDLSSKKMTRREMRGLAIIAKGGQISQINDRLYYVRSQSSDCCFRVASGEDGWTCTCPDYAKRLKPCKHVHAVTFALQLPDIVAANDLVKMPLEKDARLSQARR